MQAGDWKGVGQAGSQSYGVIWVSHSPSLGHLFKNELYLAFAVLFDALPNFTCRINVNSCSNVKDRPLFLDKVQKKLSIVHCTQEFDGVCERCARK